MGSLSEDWRECSIRPQDQRAWETLFRRNDRLLRAIVDAIAQKFRIRSADEIADALQEVRIKLSNPSILDGLSTLDEEGLERLLRASAANVAHDYFRRVRAKKRDPLVLVSISDSGDPPGVSDDLDRGILLEQLKNLADLSLRERTILNLYYLRRWKAREIAELRPLRLTVKGVESMIFRVTSQLRKTFESTEGK